MAYTANEQIAIASADSPLGPFTQIDASVISGALRPWMDVVPGRLLAKKRERLRRKVGPPKGAGFY